MRSTVLLSTLALVTSFGGDLCLGADPVGKRVSIPVEAHALALADLQNYDEDVWPYLRWVWICEPTVEECKCVSLAINFVSLSPNLIRPDSIANGHLVRIDLRAMAPKLGEVADTLQNCIDTWEKLRFDPSFSLNLTKDQVAQVLKSPDQPMARVKSGKGFIDVSFTKLASADVVRLVGPHLDQETTYALQDAVQSAAPVVESRYFLWRCLTSIQDDGAWKVIYGGLYYEFLGVKTAAELKRTKSTDEDVFFDSIGVGNLDAGLTAEKVFARLASEQRGVLFRSDVTGKPRRWDLIPTLSANTKIGQSIMSITHDTRDKDVEIGQHPVLNLKRFKDAAREALFVKANGLQGGILFDGEGKLQREVPPDVAVNRLIPQPHSPRLEPFISCLQCHMNDGNDGWKPLKNDLSTLRQELDIFGDAQKGRLPLADTVVELAGLYTGSPDKTLRRAREDQQEAALRVVDVWKKDSNLKIVKNVSTGISDLYTKHRYDLVTAEQALVECGLRVDRAKASATLKRMTPPGPDNFMGGVLLEDVRLGMLKAGGGINRVDWDFIKPLVAARVRAALPKE